MKRLLVVVALLALLLLSLPALVGLQVESEYRHLASQRAVSALDFERGWFGSRARWRLRAPNLPPLEIVDRVRHGPWLGDGFGLARVASRAQGLDGVTLATRIALDGAGETQIAWSRPLSLNGARLAAGGNAELRVSPDLGAAWVRGEAPAASLDGPGTQARLRQPRFEIRLTRAASEWDGHLSLDAESLESAARPLAPVHLEASFSRIDPYLIQALAPLLEGGRGGGLLRQLARLRIAAQVLPSFLASAPELRIEELTLGKGAGRARLSGWLTIDDAWRGDRSLLQLPQFLDAGFDADLPEPLARAWLRQWLDWRGGDGAQAGDLLDWLTRGGWLRRHAGRVEVRARVQDGILELNGKSLPVQSFLFGS